MSSTRPTDRRRGTRRLCPSDQRAVMLLWASVGDDPFFHPHDFDDETAIKVCTAPLPYYGTRPPHGPMSHGATYDEFYDEMCRDVYVGYFTSDAVIVDGVVSTGLMGYGMLRWGAYDAPSLGIVVHPHCRGQGIGEAMMAWLHGYASGFCVCVRLRVHPDNVRARAFYERLGYTFSGEMDRGELVGWFELPEGETS